MLPYLNSPRAPAQAIVWTEPLIVVFYSLLVLGGPMLIAPATPGWWNFCLFEYCDAEGRRFFLTIRFHDLPGDRQACHKPGQLAAATIGAGAVHRASLN